MAKRILFLTARLQPYLCSGINALMAAADVEILVYTQRCPENELLRFNNGPLRIFTYDYEPETFFWKEIRSFKPDLVFCAGWMYRIYLSWCRTLKADGAHTVCAMDTQWKGSFRQRIHLLIAPFTIQPSFTHAWVPGSRQYAYAQRLGFRKEQIMEGLYATDTRLFSASWPVSANRQATAFPKRLLYAGRLEPHKLEGLVKAFRDIADTEKNGWVLTIAGNGSMSDDPLLRAGNIRLLSHKSQPELAQLASEGGVFCLCSSDEPWGMVIQEFAAAGMPLLVSHQCGASDLFLKGNGWICDGRDTADIRRQLKQIFAASDKELFRMAAKSREIAMHPDPEDWAAVLCALV